MKNNKTTIPNQKRADVATDSGTLSEGSAFVITQPSTKEVKLTKEWVRSEISSAKKEVLDKTEEVAKKQADEVVVNELQKERVISITTFGIFASIISLLTIEFQFLRTICSLDKILGFTLILFSVLLGFVLSLDYLAKGRSNKGSVVPQVVLLVIFLFVMSAGIYLASRGNEEVCRENKIYLRYSEQFDEDFNELYKDVNLRLKLQDERIIELETQLQKLEP